MNRALLVHYRIPQPVAEYKFCPDRKWRFDFAFPKLRLAVEIEGGLFTGGRHSRPLGYIADMEKYNMASELGWTLLRYRPRKIDYEQIKRTVDLLTGRV